METTEFCDIAATGGGGTCDVSSPSILYTITSWIYHIITFLTLKIPARLILLLSSSITIELNLKSALFLTSLVLTLIYLVVRYRYLTVYSRLPEPEPSSKAETFDLAPDAPLFEDATGTEVPTYPSDYLRSLLASIKIFGYLEEPVFNELSRYLNTKRVVKGDIIFDDNATEKSFYIVMDGCVQVSTRRQANATLEELEYGDQPSEYIPLTEIKAGGTLSSLFTLLSLFTENVELRRAAERERHHHAVVQTLKSAASMHRSESARTHKSQVQERALVKHQDSYSAPPLRDIPLHPNIIAKATQDTTLAVLPAEAFHRLIHKYPNSSAHIVQVILTRFQRVTFLTLNKYLSMSKELLTIEQKVTDFANHSIKEVEFDNNAVRTLVNVAQRIRGSSRSSTLRMKEPLVDPTPRDPTPPSVIRLEEDHFKSHDEVLAHQELRQKTYECMAKSLGMISDFKFISRAGDLAQTLSFSDHTQMVDSPLSDHRDSDLDSDSSQSDTAPGSPASQRESYEDEVEFFHLKPGATIIDQGERVDGLYLVLRGRLNVTIGAQERPRLLRESSVSSPGFGQQRNPSTAALPSLKSTRAPHKPKGGRTPFQILPGCVAGYMGSITGSPSFVTMTAGSEVLVGYLSRKFINNLLERHPTILLTLAKRLINHLPPLLLQIDYALEWVQATANKVIYRSGDSSDSIYIVLNGRLRTIDDSQSSIKILGEFGQGDSVGELEVLTDSPRPNTLHAIRDSELARMPKSLFDSIALAHPAVTIQISRMIARRTKEQLESLATSSRSGPAQKITLGRNNSNLKTIGIIPVRGHVPLQEFVIRLVDAFHLIGESAALVDSSAVHAALGRHAFTRMGKLKLMSWLAEQEERHRILLLVADGSVSSPWTQRCIRQADCILLVGLGDEDPGVGEFERMLVGLKTTARKELVLLHGDRAVSSGTTQAWLKNRLWIHAHHHIQIPLQSSAMRDSNKIPGIVNTLHQLRDQFHRVYADVAGAPRLTAPIQPALYTGLRSDYARLARRLCGRSIGLVLGGGGARGLGHIGFLRALEEAGVPIDIVGGCSIGAYIGGLYARDSAIVAVLGRARAFSIRMSSLWRKITDLTYPVISWFSGHEFNRGIWKSFSDLRVEDLWLPYYCVTTNIAHSRLEVHQTGYLWRYVRASMSLSGFLPPLCDGDKLLVDGGYLDYLPVEVMKSMGADTIFAVDVSGEEDENFFTNYGDSLSGWYVLLSRLNPFSRALIPSLADIQSRLAYVSSVYQLEAAKRIPGCLYIRLPVQSYGTLEFKSFSAIEAAGYAHGRKCVETWEQEGLLASWIAPKAHIPSSGRFASHSQSNLAAHDPRKLRRRNSI